MNIGYRWLKALVPKLDATPEELAEALAMRGAPVDDIRSLAEGLADIRIGRVVSVVRHPDADRLSVCQVESGEGVVQVVCGAPNVRAGGVYPLAPVGASLPGGITIRKAKIRGQTSAGMLCSEKELGLGRDSAGIMELQSDLAPGAALIEALALDDARLDVEVTANRGDLLSHIGVAREVSPSGVRGIVLPPIPGATEEHRRAASEARSGKGNVPVRIEDPDHCSRYIGIVIRGIEVGPSPEWLTARLRSVGARPINNIVDATNYVLHELGQPLHAFDLHTLEGAEVVVRHAKAGEVIRTLDDVERKLAPEMLAICDASRPIAIAGVMGGAETEVSAETRDILLECALFHPPSIRATRRALGMSTDASYRYERGVDPQGMERALRRAVEVILATAGGEVEGEWTEVCPHPWTPTVVALRPERVKRILGIPFSSEGLRAILEPLGFEVDSPSEAGLEHPGSADSVALQVSIPGYRCHDVTREIDLIEEIARTYGYERFPDTLGVFRPGTVPDDALFQLQDELRDLLVERGCMEAHTTAFAPASEGEVEVLNPISVEESYLRRSLLPGLFRKVEYNFARGARSIRLFESGTVFARAEQGEPPREEIRLAVVLTGDREPAHWATPPMPLDIWGIKGLLEAVIGRSRLVGARLEPGCEGAIAGQPFDPGVAFTVVDAEGDILGRAGKVAGGVVDAPAWAGDIWALEVTLPEAPTKPLVPLYQPLPAFPGIARDLALLVPESLPAARVSEVIRERAGALLERVQIFDLYRGKGLPEGSRSLGYRLHFRSPDRTLTDKDVEVALKDVDRMLREELGVEPRGP